MAEHELETQRIIHGEAVQKVLNDLTRFEHARGEHGVIARLDQVGVPGACMKYFFAPNAFRPGITHNHQRAWEMGKKVPGPFFEFADRKSVTMQFIDQAADLNELIIERKLKFTPDVTASVVRVFRDLNEDFMHGDARYNNVLLADWQEENGVIVKGDPWIVDLDDLRPLRIGASEEWRKLQTNLRVHTVR